MRLYSYIIVKDIGLAPNPFWGYCTLAVCTPNHMGVKAQRGDWIMATSGVARGNRLVYAMQLSEVLSFECYYADERFKKKKPVVKGSWRERCGDNMYFGNSHGVWKQHRTIYHHEQYLIEKDLRHPFVFVAEHFYYFGDKAIEIPAEYRELIRNKQGCKWRHDERVVEGFLFWLQVTFSPGIHGNPADNQDDRCADCA